MRRPTPARSTAILSGLVDREILPTLRGLHREQLESADQDSRKLARLLLDEPARFQAEVMRRALRGTPWPVLAAEMLAPVARDLGVMWEDDLCDFLDVTEAMGRLQSVLRDAIGPQVGRGRARLGRSILLAGAPGETHTYGLCHVAGLLRDVGWTTTTVAGTGADPLAALTTALATGWYDVLGLSLACDAHSPALRRAMPVIRRASRNPALRVVVGGALVARGGAEPGLWGADACLTDPALLSPVQPAA
ncbi:cobalamin-dependent protein [Methylobacterium sp. J-067]|uniref:cobalamin-dependent protein n=1 Tax=Methylobacterium sp. J-067 TaxID=2836648 RepID=UPI001FBBDE5F|nr:cobalamin-dependent protein [Methylobacterium sp. J-067]MCJ2024417.1 cobalamin B12-binding domain-containing protein [Methylobacterium sp. J-067]